MAAALISTSYVATGPASAWEPTRQGWWSVASIAPATSPAPTAPDVPADGLLVQGGPSDDAPIALGALVYKVPDGASQASLRLTVAAGSGTTPNGMLRLCLLGRDDFAEAQGGAMTDAPSYSCDAETTAQPDAAGKTYQFDVGSLIQGHVLAVALLPGGPSDRIVLEHPAASSLVVEGAPATADGVYDPVATDAPVTSSGPTFTDPGRPPAASPDIEVPAASGPATAADAQLDDTSQALDTTGAPDGEGGSNDLRWLMIGALVLVGGLWKLAGESGDPLPQSGADPA